MARRSWSGGPSRHLKHTLPGRVELGARELVEPQDFPGGRFAIVMDPQGASFGLLKTRPRAEREG